MLFSELMLALVCVLNILLGAFVLLRNSRAIFSRLFFAMTVFTTLWAVANFLTNVGQGSIFFIQLCNQVAYASAFAAIFFGLMFTYNFPTRRESRNPEKYALLTVAVVGGVLSLTPLVGGSVHYGSHKELVYSNGLLIVVYVASLLLFLGLIIRNLLASFSDKEEDHRQQASWILFGFGFTILAGIVCNIILPAIADSWISTQYGPVLSVVLVGSIGYAIVRHGMFDIRAAVARSLGYILSIAIIVAVYGLVVFGVARSVFDLRLSTSGQIFLIVATTLLGVLFQPLLKIFNTLTKKIFFQDAYDPQWLFHHLNKVLVSSLDMKYLMMQSISVIESALKPEFALVGMKETEGGQRIFTSRKMHIDDTDIATIRKLTPHYHEKVIVADSLVDDRFAELRSTMRKYNIAVIVRLTQNARRTEEGLGYLALGAKKSGSTYTTMDVRVLDTVANELIIAAQNAMHFEEIQNFNVLLQTRVDDATRKLRRTNEKLKALDETKDDFISMASHQLRTPLTSVKGYLSMVLEGDAGEINETQKKMLGQAFISSQRMVYLIADLLNVSRLRTGKFVIEPNPTNLAHMVSEELDQLVESAAAKGITLTYDQPKEFPELMLDETKTRQVIMNFADNAIYYTPAGGHIKVELRDTPTSVELRVIDDGIGVPKAEQHHLFTKFYRAANARQARPDGTGLGLFMAKKVVLAQGGSVIFESKEGKGSTFGFLFPKNTALKVESLPVASAQTEAK